MAGLQIVNIAARASQFLWILLTLALVGNMESFYSGPSIVNYDMFVSVFSFLTLLYLLPATFSDKIAFHWALPLTLDALNVLFVFIAAVATPGYIGVHSCSDQAYLNSTDIFGGYEQRCREAQASTAFYWFAFASFLVTLITTAAGGRGGVTHTTTARRGPAMSQV